GAEKGSIPVPLPCGSMRQSFAVGFSGLQSSAAIVPVKFHAVNQAVSKRSFNQQDAIVVVEPLPDNSVTNKTLCFPERNRAPFAPVRGDYALGGASRDGRSIPLVHLHGISIQQPSGEAESSDKPLQRGREMRSAGKSIERSASRLHNRRLLYPDKYLRTQSEY